MADTDDRVERTIELRAPRARGWRAISNGKDFGTWFGLGDPLTLEGDFVPGAKIMGVWGTGSAATRELFCTIEEIEPERLFAFRWHPYELPAGDDRSKHPTTRIEFRLEDIEIGTRLTVSESGFSKLPADKQYTRARNGRGWEIQAHSIAAFVLGGVTVRVEQRIPRPVAEVFEAIVDPAKMAQYFITRGSGRIALGAKLEWEWSDVGAKLSVEIGQFEPGSKIGFAWSASGMPTKVTLVVAPDGPNATKLTALEAPFALTDEGVARALEQTRGWTDFCLCLKAYLVHGINLRRGTPADHVA
jgi:uncharacterized protein YndB with AHSA1/START domain